MQLFLCSFHFNLCSSLLSPHRHIEVFLASFLSLLFISPLAISQTPRYVWQCVLTHGALSSCSLLPSHLSVPISSQHPFCSAFTQIVFLRTFSSFLSATNRKRSFLWGCLPTSVVCFLSLSPHLLSPSVHHLPSPPFRFPSAFLLRRPS